MTTCLHCAHIAGCAKVGDVCDKWVQASLWKHRDVLNHIVGTENAYKTLTKTKENKMANNHVAPQAQEIIDAVNAGNINAIDSLYTSDVALPYLVISAGIITGNPSEVGQRMSGEPDKRKFLCEFLKQLSNEVGNTVAVPVASEPAVEVAEPAPVAQIVEALPEVVDAPKKRRRRTRKEIEAERIAEMKELMGDMQGTSVDLSPVVDLIKEVAEVTQAGLSDNNKIMVAVNKENAQILARYNVITKDIDELHRKVDCFKEAFVEFEMALLTNGVIQSAPFTEAVKNWGN